MRSRIANLATRSVRYLEAGSGAPVVLIHAFPLNAEQWLPQLARVTPGVRIIAPDLRGFAGSEPFTGLSEPRVSMDTYASDVLELMSHLEITRAAIGGLSMGGYVALALVRKAPARVAGLLLADTRATGDTPDARAARDRMLEQLARDGAAGVAATMVPKLLGETTRREQSDLSDVVTRLIASSQPVGIAAAIRAMKDRPDSLPDLATFAYPATIVCGEEDVVTPLSDSEAMHRAIPGSTLVVIPRAGHLSNLESPLAFNDALFSLARTALRPQAAWPPARSGQPR